jgi:hypothetical protein
MTKMKLYYSSSFFATLLLSCAILIGGATAPLDKVKLKRSETLSIEERLNWREALEFPSHCENGIYEWDDESHPRLNFIDVNTEKYLVRSYCSLKPNEVNLFLVDKNNPHEKPHLLELKIPVEAGNTNAETDWLEDDATEEDWALRAERIQLTEIYTSRTTSLVPGGMFVNDQGQLVIHKSGIASGKCGIHSVYDLNSQAKLVSFRAQSSCMGSSDVSRWKTYYKSDLIPADK